MSVELKVPTLPESVADATIAKIYKQVGDVISQDENLVDLETDKVMIEVPAPVSGVLKSLSVAEGDVVNTDHPLMVIEEGAAPAKSSKKADKKVDKAVNKAADARSVPVVQDLSDLSPAVRKLVQVNNVDLSKVTGSGKNGRVTKEDVEAFMAGGSSSKPAAPAVASPQGPRAEERVPMSRIRARIAERLVQSKLETAMLTTFNEVNMQPVMDLRSQYKDLFLKKHDVKLGFMSFFVKAVTEALRRFPDVNAYIDGTDLVYHAYQDIGIAIGSERGLVVPILRNVEQMGMADIEAKIKDYAGLAQTGKLSLEDMTGGTFTITNGGTFGSMMSTPIINPPQSAILGMHNIVKRAVVENDEILIRPMMYLALSYDHRVIDGSTSVKFLVTIKELLEDPARLILEV